MLCLRRSFQIKKLGLAVFYRINHYKFHIATNPNECLSIYSYSRPVFFNFSVNRSVWTSPCLLTQLSVDSTRASSGLHPSLWSYANPSLNSQDAKPNKTSKTDLASGPTNPQSNEPKKLNESNSKKLSLWQRTKKEIVHYYHGFRLLGLEVKIASGICFRLLWGHSLTRRERKQLVRTVADIVRLVPFVVFIIVPFMEFLLPFYLKFFPFMLPSTFKEKSSESDRIQQRLKAKLELTRFLQETLNHTTGATSREVDSPTVNEFQEFLKKVQESGKPPSNDDITRFSQLFEDQVTLDSLQTKQLKMLCQLLSLPTVGPNNLLRFQIRMRVRQLKAEDILLAKEGVSQIPSWELQSLCQDRGMRSVGLTEERLRSQLSQWLALHLEQNVPVTLLLFSRALHVSKATADELSLKEAIAQLPISASEEVAARVLETTPSSDVDPRTKIEVLRKEQASIKAARQQRKQELAEQAEVKAEAAAEVLKDTAPAVKGLSDEDLESVKVSHVVQPGVVPPEPIGTTSPVPMSGSCPSCTVATEVKPTQLEKAHEEVTEITVDDLTQIESAIAESSNAIHEEAIEGLKEEVAETAKVREQLEASLVAADRVVDKRTSKAASRLSANVNRMIGEMDHLIGKLNEERQQILKDIELREVRVKHSVQPTEQTEILDAIKADHERMIDINDLLLSLRRIQKVPDETRWQKILEVLDEDHDGKIELQHVLSVIELLGAENVKLSPKEVKRVLEMLDNEDLIEQHVDSNKTGTAPLAGNDHTKQKDEQDLVVGASVASSTTSTNLPRSAKHSDTETTSKSSSSK